MQECYKWFNLSVNQAAVCKSATHVSIFQSTKLRNELELLRHNYRSANEEIQGLRVALEESRANGDRLHRESELVVQNVNTWVQEQKSVLHGTFLCLAFLFSRSAHLLSLFSPFHVS